MEMSAKKIETNDAPKAIGPYSQGVSIPMRGELLFISGQLPIDPKTVTLIEGDIVRQTHRVIDNLEAILEKAGSNLKCVLRTDIFLKNLKQDFQLVNQEYAKRFCTQPEPARQTVEVSDLPLGSLIEISCIAYVGEKNEF